MHTTKHPVRFWDLPTLVFSGYLLEAKPYQPFIGPKLPNNATWQEACVECHLAYHPSLLPARSWQRTLAEQHEHFGEDLYLELAACRINR